MAMVALLNQGNSKYMDVLHYWGEITRLQKCWWEFRASGKNDIPSSVALLSTPFLEGTPLSARISVIPSLTKCKLIWLARTLTSFYFNFHLKNLLLMICILDPFIKKKHTCGFIGTKQEKYFNKQTSEVQLPRTSVKHLPNIKLCTCSYCHFHLYPLGGNCDNWGGNPEWVGDINAKVGAPFTFGAHAHSQCSPRWSSVCKDLYCLTLDLPSLFNASAPNYPITTL